MSAHAFHPEARAEYLAALIYLEEEREGYGERFEAEVDTTLDRVRSFPRSGARVEGLPRSIEARVFPLRRFRYSLMVVLAAEGPVVYAVAHQSRRVDYWFQRLG
jgi:hypothetical protein